MEGPFSFSLSVFACKCFSQPNLQSKMKAERQAKSRSRKDGFMYDLYIAQKAFSLWGKFDVVDANGEAVFIVEGKPSLMRRLTIFSHYGKELCTLVQKFAFLPTSIVEVDGRQTAEIKQESVFTARHFVMNPEGWYATGNFFAMDFEIFDHKDNMIGRISRELLHFTDHYQLSCICREDALNILLFVLAIDGATTKS